MPTAAVVWRFPTLLARAAAQGPSWTGFPTRPPAVMLADIMRCACCAAVLMGLLSADTVAEESRMALQIESPAFANGADIPSRYTCEGDDIAPALNWRGIPGGTRSLVGYTGCSTTCHRIAAVCPKARPATICPRAPAKAPMTGNAPATAGPARPWDGTATFISSMRWTPCSTD
jgi:hypothetical protein